MNVMTANLMKKIFPKESSIDASWRKNQWDEQVEIDHDLDKKPPLITHKRKSVELERKSSLENRRKSCGPVIQSPGSATHLEQPRRKRGRPRKNQYRTVTESKEPDCEIPVPEPYRYSREVPASELDKDLASFLENLLREDEEEALNFQYNQLASAQPEYAIEPIEQVSRKSSWDSDLNTKRSKWTEEELLRLWQGIAKHGNNWTAIRGTCLGRSYCQIKDKGRRCLFLLGWETGRSKLETESSSLHAKRIAKDVLAELE